MRRVALNEVKEGNTVAVDLYDVKGHQLLKTGAQVSEFNLEKLKLYNIPFIYLDDRNVEISAVFDMKTRAELFKVLGVFYESEGENSAILKAYNIEQINAFLSYNNEAGSKIAFGHIFRYFAAEMAKCLKKTPAVYDFIDYRSQETYYFFHMVNVAALSLVTGAAMGFSKEELADLGVGALLYDMKMMLYSFVENSSELSAAQKEEMRQHAALSFDIIRKIYGIPARSAAIAAQHHERFDGSGYPKKLKSNDISLFARVVAVCDVYDALASNRPFRPAYAPEEARDYITSNSGVLFDPDVVKAFSKVVPRFMPGDIVELSDGSAALVAKSNPLAIDEPSIIVIEKKGKSDIIPNTLIDLSAQKELKVSKTIQFIR